MIIEESSSHANINVVLADDHILVRQGIRQFLEETGDIEVKGEAGDGAEAVQLVQQLSPDVVVMDINMPKVTGVEATRRIKQHFPETKVLILTAYDDAPYIRALLHAGADGYILKTAPAEELVKAVRNVYQGLAALSPAVATQVVYEMTHQHSPGTAGQAEALTEREIDVLRLAAKGMTNREIGQQLHISHRTVQGHLANTYEKLDANSRTEAVTVAIRRGWIVVE
ncbi:MAG: response regulator transcription factor [Anaerolineae bacterium]|nr:response regulator transcription factor [Anaerolineae bacterium]